MKILISDVTIHNRTHLKDFLSQSGLEVVGMAASGEETRALAKVFSPAVILLDVNLPDVDVYELIGDLRKANHPPVVILMTTRLDPEVNRRGLLAGASACLAKSEGIDLLLEAIYRTNNNHNEGARH